MSGNSIRFDGRVAIVTGAGGGLGRAHALLLASRGAKVVVNDLGGNPDGTGGSHSMAQRVVDEIRAAGGKAVPNYDSVGTPEGGEAITRTAVEEFGGVHIVIHNAGILRDKTFAKLGREDLDAIFDVHLKGAFHVAQPAFRVMKEKEFGRLIFTTSTAGLFGNFGQSNYAAAKFGVVGLSNVLALEGERYNIRSNVIAPTARTRLTESILGPLAEFLAPEQVAPLVAYLCSEECNLTHEVFSVGGGRFARVFTAVGPGWFCGKGVTPSLEDVRDHLTDIRATEPFAVPLSAGEETGLLVKELKLR